jgi:hypothetical protein
MTGLLKRIMLVQSGNKAADWMARFLLRGKALGFFSLLPCAKCF